MGKEDIQQYIKAAHPSFLRPLQFFPAWQGVLTLAFSGFPPSFKKLKEEINENLAAAIPKESPGSMWPKMTLGALKDHVRLTPEMLGRISKICSEVSSDFDLSDPASTSQISGAPGFLSLYPVARGRQRGWVSCSKPFGG
uniref:Uncharacterized protein n=1 Tax=Dunaliella tertiolecta TaxID=3047 RepID=A0A7S3QKY1_DUNTE